MTGSNARQILDITQQGKQHLPHTQGNKRKGWSLHSNKGWSLQSTLPFQRSRSVTPAKRSDSPGQEDSSHKLSRLDCAEASMFDKDMADSDLHTEREENTVCWADTAPSNTHDVSASGPAMSTDEFSYNAIALIPWRLYIFPL